MKKLLAMTLALVLALGMVSPALADEVGVYLVEGEPVETVPANDATELLNIADETPEVQEFLRQMYEEGLLQENTAYDLSYFEGEDTDAYAEYEAAHPEEIANLDVDALIAAWGYRDKTAEEQFLEYYDWYGDTLEDAVKGCYIANRLDVNYYGQEAEEYRAEYPEEWESFDADAYFEEEFTGEYGWESKEAYMSSRCILTQEEFVDYMFYWYIWDLGYPLYDYDDYYDWDYGYDEPPEERTLTLMVNGVASEAEVIAENGVSYVDADALRAILGDKAVGADVTGPVAVRAAAETAGWDVEWYDGGWRWYNDPEIQLWDKASFEAQLDEEFGPLNDLMAKMSAQSWEKVMSQEGISGKETVDVVWTAFSTLDGNKDYKFKLTLDYVAQNGVMDMTVTFDVAQLLDLMSPVVLAQLGKDGAPTLEQFTGLLKAGKMEFILDYNRGAFAYNVPLLGLMDEDMKGWQTEYFYGWEEARETMMSGGTSFTSTLYADMVNDASDYWKDGAEKARAEYDRSVGMLSVFLGKDRFTTTAGGGITYSLTTQAANRAMGQVLKLDEPDKYTFFKACDITCSLSARGDTTMKMHVRPDVDGIMEAVAASMDEDDYYYSYPSMTALLRMNTFDMDLTASGVSDKNGGSSQLNVHINNAGKLDVRCQTTVKAATRTPRRIEDVERAWVYRPADGVDFSRRLLALVGR